MQQISSDPSSAHSSAEAIANTTSEVHLTGQHYLAGQWQAAVTNFFPAINASTFEPLPWQFADCQQDELELACQAATDAFVKYRQRSAQDRAEFLRQISFELKQSSEALWHITALETALPKARLQGELNRTCMQLEMFATYLSTTLDHAIVQQSSDTTSLPPKADLKLTQLPLGPVAVFAASNFPYAFSVAGGDTASALAAGCPVIIKAHSAHPATSEWVMRAIEKAIRKCNMPAAVVSLLQAKSYPLSHQLVQHPAIKAAAFTGSMRVGMALRHSINQRPDPIPFYAELGSLNPQLILPELSHDTVSHLAQHLVTSTTGSGGQLCTKPGLWLVPETDVGENLLTSAVDAMTTVPAQSLLHPGIYQTYQLAATERQHHAQLIAGGMSGERQAQARLYSCSLAEFITNPQLQEEI
ncbi:MAG: aldehyde dehydrogenase family protein, partial [Gammaproteobacteria bacterium]|nr:aldehyde dehydrogenase family protein [Gammaproteobacteria bacterium]